MSDEMTTTGLKARGRARTYTDAEAALAFDLYCVKGLTGRVVATALGRPRNTVLEMVKRHQMKVGGAATTPQPPAPERIGQTTDAITAYRGVSPDSLGRGPMQQEA